MPTGRWTNYLLERRADEVDSAAAADEETWPRCETGTVNRPLTERERAVLDALLAVEIDSVEHLREEAGHAVVVSGCRCGCPSIDFYSEPGVGMHIRVNARVDGTIDGLFLYTVGGHIGGIEWVGASEQNPDEFPDPSVLIITPASP